MTSLSNSIQGELEHKMLKRRFVRTNKKKFISQLTVAELRERVMRRIAQHLRERAGLSQIRTSRKQHRKRDQAEADSDEEDTLESGDTSRRYFMAKMSREHENILEWAHANRTDIVTKVFYWLAKSRHTY